MSKLLRHTVDIINEEKDKSMVWHCLELSCYPLLTLLDKLLPVERCPLLAFLLILLVFFFFIDFILIIVSVLSMYTHLSHLIIALTFISWCSSAMEIINLTVSARTNKLQLGLSSILSSVVLAFYVLVPLAILFKML